MIAKVNGEGKLTVIIGDRDIGKIVSYQNSYETLSPKNDPFVFCLSSVHFVTDFALLLT